MSKTLKWDGFFKVKKVKKKREVFTIKMHPVLGNKFDWNRYKNIIPK